MIKILVWHVFIVITLSFWGCGSLQNQVSLKNQNISEVKTEPSSQNDPLFQGEVIKINATDKGDLRQAPFTALKNEPCFKDIDQKVNAKLTRIGFKNSTNYFKLPSNEQEIYNLSLSSEQFAQIKSSDLKKFDLQSSYLDFRNLYFLKNANDEYLLMIGHDKATSGWGHLYRSHIILPLTSGKPLIEFQSLTGDPRKVKINNSGTVYYTQVDGKVGAVLDDATDMKMTVSLFVSNDSDTKKMTFQYHCKNIIDTDD